ncbi:MAG TPA: DUF998 domain-containing protein [Pseudonocardia sp.]|nr:DUF998 domain-containing protein [Pseudonocardia sp.]
MSSQQQVWGQTVGPDRQAAAPRRAGLVALAVAGVVGPVVFVAVGVGQGLARPGYSFAAEPVVALVNGPAGWIQDMNFVVLGVLVMACAAGLHLGLRRMRWGWTGPRCSR